MIVRTKCAQLLAGSVLLWASAGFAAGDAAAPAPKPAAGDDPRECLKLSSNLEIAICAERYRPKSRR